MVKAVSIVKQTMDRRFRAMGCMGVSPFNVYILLLCSVKGVVERNGVVRHRLKTGAVGALTNLTNERGALSVYLSVTVEERPLEERVIE
jgi:hypothetical protein